MGSLTQKETRLHPARGELRPGRLGPQHRLCEIPTQCFSPFAVILRDVTGHGVGSQHGQPGVQSKKQEGSGHLLLVYCTWGLSPTLRQTSLLVRLLSKNNQEKLESQHHPVRRGLFIPHRSQGHSWWPHAECPWGFPKKTGWGTSWLSL